ncbi:MAG TPA: 5'/3'-nucleotidase SurE [Dongiaceae bacterium]|jgi:5'-nucleotidase|nr:5'/3'-nucleotidase SurE [Dongiaceae bacterium]
MLAKNARILVTNDDGIHAPGLRVLERVARQLSSDVWVVAPETEQSGMAHSLTLHRPLRLHKLGRRRYAVSGTPTDCVLVAVNHLLKDKVPALVLSGVNRGANLGEDITYSGTVAAAMESALLGLPAIAMSQVREGDKLHWNNAGEFGARIIRKLMGMEWRRGTLVNVNYPALPPDRVRGIRVGAQGRRLSMVQVVEADDPFARKVLWIGDFPSDAPERASSDLAIIEQGYIAVTPLHVDLTHRPLLGHMRTLFDADS